MSSTDDTQETTSAQDNTQETRETTCATDNTQDTIESAESPYYSLFADDLLEETIKEVRKLRPRLLEFMKRFREQQGQMQCLKNEIADLRRSQENLAEFATVESSDSNSRCGSVTSCNKTRNERLKSFANAVKTLLKHTKAAKTQSAEFCGMNRKKALEEARTELNMVEATFGELEDVYQEEQQKLYRYQQRVESLKEKLCKAREEIQRKAMSGDVPFGPCSPDSLTRFPAIVDSYHTGSIVLDSLSLLFNGEEPITAKFNAAGDLENTTLRVREKQQYRMRLNFFVTTNANNLKYVQKVSRLRVNVTKKVFTIGSYTLSNTLQYFVLPPETAPEGLFHRGKHKVKSQILDENGREHASWHWTLKVVKDV
ncbi:hypothetical protein Y032_0169g227 [Ancylostoma ceylanicum]|uniref:RHO protein GDP dissociation inhibitor n=1 Tax=Ancylostoma ceylanicum TaxID=53326 RepID=A0A016SVB4_9BILA|nr:hypothetical protein Y032_0169g227 [Ancylostoma ceylanicum]